MEVRHTFNAFILANFDAATAAGIISKVDWNAWILQGGDNPYKLDFHTQEADDYQNLADTYITLDSQKKSPDNIGMYLNETNINLKVIFHSRLLSRAGDVSYSLLARIDADLKATNDANPEIG